MKKRISILIIIFIFILAACSEETIERVEVEAIVNEVDIENESLTVEGIGLNNPLGNLSVVDVKGAEIKRTGKKVDLSEIKVGDRIFLEIGEVAESYPSQTESMKVNILEKVNTDQNSEKEEVGRVFIKESPDKITIYSEGLNITELKLLSLEYDEDKDKLLEKEILKEKLDIEPGEKTNWEVVYGEGLPSMKLNWELSNGERGEYIIAYNGRYGRNPDKTIIYYNNGERLVEYEEMDDEEIDEKSEFKDVKLYFIVVDEKDSYLVEETHRIDKVSGIAKLTLDTLRDVNPKTKNAINPIYKSTKINSIYIKDRIIVVDFSKEIENSNFGSTAEALQVQAIVNTLTQFPTVDGVIFKVDGKEDIESWLSHIGNVGVPFTEDRSIVK